MLDLPQVDCENAKANDSQDDESENLAETSLPRRRSQACRAFLPTKWPSGIRASGISLTLFKLLPGVLVNADFLLPIQ